MDCKENCSHSVPHDRSSACKVSIGPFCPLCTPEESKTEYNIKCRYCGDIQIANEMSFEKIIENGCDSECCRCGKQGYEPIIPEGLFVLSYENLIEAIQDHPCLELVDGEPEKDDDCLCDKEPVVWVVVAGRGELNWGCPDCRKIYGNWKPIHLRKKKECWLCEGTGSVMMDRQTGAMFAKEPTINWSEKDCYEHQCPNCDNGPEPSVDIDIVKEGKYSLPDKSIYPLKCPKCKVVYDSDIVIIPNRCSSCGYEPLKDLADNVGVPPA